MLPPHKTLKHLPKKIEVAPRTAPTAIADVSDAPKRGVVRPKARVAPAPLRVLGKAAAGAQA